MYVLDHDWQFDSVLSLPPHFYLTCIFIYFHDCIISGNNVNRNNSVVSYSLALNVCEWTAPLRRRHPRPSRRSGSLLRRPWAQRMWEWMWSWTSISGAGELGVCPEESEFALLARETMMKMPRKSCTPLWQLQKSQQKDWRDLGPKSLRKMIELSSVFEGKMRLGACSFDLLNERRLSYLIVVLEIFFC